MSPGAAINPSLSGRSAERPLRSRGAAVSGGLVLALSILPPSLLLAAPPAGAELPPWVYGERQRAAPLQLELRVLSTRQQGDTVEYDARITAIRRQPQPPLLRQGERIHLRAPLPPPRAPGWVGPSPVPLLRRGQQVPAWLTPIEGRRGWFAPAAGGVSFGPSLEAFQSGGP